MRPLEGEFYSCSALELSEKLLGKTLIHVVDGIPIGGIITETEAYMGVSDKASHAYGGGELRAPKQCTSAAVTLMFT